MVFSKRSRSRGPEWKGCRGQTVAPLRSEVWGRDPLWVPVRGDPVIPVAPGSLRGERMCTTPTSHTRQSVETSGEGPSEVRDFPGDPPSKDNSSPVLRLSCLRSSRDWNPLNSSLVIKDVPTTSGRDLPPILEGEGGIRDFRSLNSVIPDRSLRVPDTISCVSTRKISSP